MPEIEKISKKYDIKMPSYGHAGDGNLHTTLVKNPNTTIEEWHEIEEKALQELYNIVYELGGKLSGEHGIGLKRKKYMKDYASEAEIMLMKKIKKAFDPNNIMNPGKIID
jgi:glycolate oxidase